LLGLPSRACALAAWHGRHERRDAETPANSLVGLAVEELIFMCALLAGSLSMNALR